MAPAVSPPGGRTDGGTAGDLLGIIGDAERRGIARAVFNEILTEGPPADLVQDPGMHRLLSERTGMTPRRFEERLRLVLECFVRTEDAEVAGRVAQALLSRAFARIENAFTVVPPDPLSRELVPRLYARVVEAREDRGADFLELLASANFLEFRLLYRQDEEFYRNALSRLSSLMLAPTGPTQAARALELLCRDGLVGLQRCATAAGQSEAWERAVFALLARPEEAAAFFDLLDIYARRYRIQANTAAANARRATSYYLRLVGIWEHLMVYPHAQRANLRRFFQLYGKSKDDFQEFVWDCVYSVVPEKHAVLVGLFVSDTFASIRNFYTQDSATLKILIRSIVAAMLEARIRNLNAALFRIVLQLLLKLRVERNFLKRRARFYGFLRKHTNALRVELEFVRLLLFEYIFIGAKQVRVEPGMVMTQFVDSLHREFCEVVDQRIGQGVRMTAEERHRLYAGLMERLRETVWRPAVEKFPGGPYLVETLRSAAESAGVEDAVLAALETVEPGELSAYHESFMDYFRRAPDRLVEAAAPDFWYRLPLARAMPHLQAAVLPIVGSVAILPGNAGAYTEGRCIYLPEYVNFFRDPREPLEANRNLTFYLGGALHEAGHLIGGTFAVDFQGYAARQEQPNLFRYVHNVFEDFRIEKFLIEIGAHPQAEEVLRTLNVFFSLRNAASEVSAVRLFLMFVFDAAWGLTRELASDTYQARRREILALSYSSGRFRSLVELEEYAVERLKQTRLGNPLGVFPLTQEIYDIIKHWPPDAHEGPFDWESFWSGLHNRLTPSGAPPDAGDLNDLYRRCNEHPEEFLEEHELPFFPELFPSKARPGGDGAQGSEGGGRKGMERLVDDLLPDEPPAHPEGGSIDFSTRTRVDELAGEKQLKRELKPRPKRNDRAQDGRVKRVYTIDRRTKARTRLSEIREFTLRGRDTDFMRKMRRWQGVELAVQRMLARLLPRLDDDVELNLFEGDINLDRMIEVLSEPGNSAPNFLELTVETRQSVEVVIGLDTSGSTSRWVAQSEEFTHESERLMIVDVEKAFAMIFARALHFLSQDVTVCAFNSMTSTNVYLASDIEAVSLFKPDNGNRDGDFIRYVTAELSRHPADLKYFFLISDGMPESMNYSGDEALQDTLMAMRESVQAGIRLVYFNVDTVKADYYDSFAAEATYAEHFRRPEGLLPAIPRMLRRMAQAAQ